MTSALKYYIFYTNVNLVTNFHDRQYSQGPRTSSTTLPRLDRSKLSVGPLCLCVLHIRKHIQSLTSQETSAVTDFGSIYLSLQIDLGVKMTTNINSRRKSSEPNSMSFFHQSPNFISTLKFSPNKLANQGAAEQVFVLFKTLLLFEATGTTSTYIHSLSSLKLHYEFCTTYHAVLYCTTYNDNNANKIKLIAQP